MRDKRINLPRKLIFSVEITLVWSLKEISPAPPAGAWKIFLSKTKL